MSRTRTYWSCIIGALSIALVVALGCNSQPATTAPVAALSATPQHTITQKGSVKEMVIWPETQEFPEHEGKAEFVSYCGICHSLRYITMQPAFPRKTWEAEVHKMIDKYGAPIDSVNSAKIVGYLLAINGTEK